MEQDKKLKDLFAKYAAEEVPVGFTNNVMQRIEAAYAVKPHKTSLFQHQLLRIIMLAFVLVCIALLIVSVWLHPDVLPSRFTIQLPADYYSQIISFLVAFWVVLLTNQLVKKITAKKIRFE